MSKILKRLIATHETLSQTIMEETAKVVRATKAEEMVDSTAAEISARYWLAQFLEPLSRKELQSIATGFLVQLLNDEQAKKLVKFLLIRFPSYYTDEFLAGKEKEQAPQQNP